MSDGPHAIGSGENALLLHLNGHLPQRLIEGSRSLFIKVETVERLSG
jgi:hypothetical protein